MSRSINIISLGQSKKKRARSEPAFSSFVGKENPKEEEEEEERNAAGRGSPGSSSSSQTEPDPSFVRFCFLRAFVLEQKKNASFFQGIFLWGGRKKKKGNITSLCSLEEEEEEEEEEHLKKI